MKPMLNPGVRFHGGPPNDPFYSSPFSSYFNRQTPNFGQPDIRIYEMNKRLQQRTEDSDDLWWDAFATEFFEDDATLTLTFRLEDSPKRYTIGRTLIPRYFRSIFEGEVTDLYFILKHAKESFHNTTITLDCDQCTMVAHHGKPMYNKNLGGQYPNELMKEQLAKNNVAVVCTEGRLILEFTFDDLMRIKYWHFATRQHREFVPRSLIALQAQQQDPAMLEQLSKNTTRQGLTNSTLNYLRLCVILEPMQELMSRHKSDILSPRDCLKTTLHQKWQRMVAPTGGSHRPGLNDFKMQPEVEPQRPPSKRKKKKAAAASNAGAGAGKKKNNMSPGPPNFSLASQDVMVVGEPSPMGGEFGDEDERFITRLENNKYDATAINSLDDGDEFSGKQLGPGPNRGCGPPPPNWSGGPPIQQQDRNQTGGPGSIPQSQNQEDKKQSPSRPDSSLPATGVQSMACCPPSNIKCEIKMENFS